MPVDETPGPEVLERIRGQLLSSLAPVRPLPSDRVLIVWFMAVFAAAALVETIPAGFSGLRALTRVERLVMYAAVLLSSMLLAMSLVTQMIPASRRRLSPAASVASAAAAIGLAAVVLFHDFTLARFAALGLPCFILGTVCALPGALLIWLFLRRGMVTSPVRAGAIAGAFAGLVGVGVLSLHCPILNSMHVLVWHLGVMAAAAGAGATIASLTGMK